jgi:sugar lactone lactonase YvrE
MYAELLLDSKSTLGESPIWDAKTQTLYWVDILQKKIYANFDLLIEVDDLVGCVAPCKNGNLLLGKRASFVDFEPVTGKQTVFLTLNESVQNRINDGKCDPVGRFVVGTMDLNEKDATGSVYVWDGKQASTLFRGVTISNGMAWSPNHQTFYYIDTPTRKIQSFDYDVQTGQVANGRVVIEIPELFGWPDGMTSDTQGNLWVAMWGGAQITKWNPNTGELLEKISVPVLQPSSCVFGGKNMNELFITSARKDMSESDLKNYPLSGGLFKVVTNVEGMPTFEFG